MRTTGEDIDFGKDLRHPCRARTVTAADINATGNSKPDRAVIATRRRVLRNQVQLRVELVIGHRRRKLHQAAAPPCVSGMSDRTALSSSTTRARLH
jgi:hypothetical protein